jgi:YidC/Oxa1 family membrane protein insertase
MMEHGINPIAQLGGCLPMIAQMPIFMGLYYCLQENVFFRLESFLWIPNLAAPDMLFYWGNWMKMLGLGIGDTLYLGPYFNLLPAITVTLYILQQKFMMPPAADEQQKFQQGMMKYMMIFVGIMFYKVAAGLCMYFIFSTLWGLAERKLIPKPKPKPLDETKNKGGAKKQKSAFQLWLEKILEEAQKKNR